MAKKSKGKSKTKVAAPPKTKTWGANEVYAAACERAMKAGQVISSNAHLAAMTNSTLYLVQARGYAAEIAAFLDRIIRAAEATEVARSEAKVAEDAGLTHVGPDEH